MLSPFLTNYLFCFQLHWKKENFELEIGDIKNGEFNFKLKYYVYQVEKGSLSETITIEINVTLQNHLRKQ